MTFEKAIIIRDELQQSVDILSDKLQNYPRSETGLTPSSITESIKWQQDKSDFNSAMNDLQLFNKCLLSQFKKEYRQYRLDQKLNGSYANN